MKSPDFRGQIVVQAARELRAWTEKYEQYGRMTKAIQSVRKVVKALETQPKLKTVSKKAG